MRSPVAAALLFFSLSSVTALPACSAHDGEDAASEDAALEAASGEFDEDATPLRDEDFDLASALSDRDDVVTTPEDAEIEVTLPAAPATAESFLRPAFCQPGTSLDLLVYYEVFAGQLYPALAQHASGCSQYWVAIPKVAASAKSPDANLFPRKLHVENVHGYGKAFRATAELHWGSTHDLDGNAHPGWKNVEVVKTGKATYETREIPRAQYFRVGWYEKGVLFRQRMAKAGYLVQNGDTWHVNELESSWARSPAYLKAVRDLVRGLSDGDPEYDAFVDADPEITAKTDDEKRAINASAHAKGVRGVLYLAALGKRIDGETTDAGWMDALKLTLRRKRLWADMADYVEYWGQERYAAPSAYCVAGRSLDEQTAAMQAYAEALPELALAAPRYESGARAGQSTVGTALFYLSHRYTPVVSAAWIDPKLSGKEMGDFVSGQVYAVRRFAIEHATADGRLGVYWRPRTENGVDVTTDPANQAFAERVAMSVNGAYDGRDGSAIAACGPAGAAGCRCGD